MQAADRDAAVNVVMARTGKTRPEAEQVVDNWVQTYQTARAKLKQTAQAAEHQAHIAGEKTASALSKAALLAFVGMLLGAGAASLGGRVGTPPLLRDEAVATQ